MLRCFGLASLTLALLSGCENGNAVEVTEPEQVTIPVHQWVNLDSPPMGDWLQYSWAPLLDGTGLLIAGGANPEGGVPESTNAAAWFEFATMTWHTLPSIPGGHPLGQAKATHIGDQLVVMGTACPVMPGSSDAGVDFCYTGSDTGTLTLLTITPDASQWTRATLPGGANPSSSPEDRPFVGLELVGGDAQTGALFALDSSGPTRVFAFEPSAGDWKELPTAPGAASLSPSTIATTTSVVGPPTVPEQPIEGGLAPSNFCLVGHTLYGWPADAYRPSIITAHSLDFSADPPVWSSAPLADAPLTAVSCGRGGLALMNQEPPSIETKQFGKATLGWLEPGTSAKFLPDSATASVVEFQRYNLVATDFVYASNGSNEGRYLNARTGEAVTIPRKGYASYEIIGDLAVDYGDVYAPWSDRSAQRNPTRIFRLQ
jgi:hypothetical protein